MPCPENESCIRREVTATREEFVRGLAAVFPAGRFATDRFSLAHGAIGMLIEIADGPVRRLGILSLPTLRVTIRMSGGTAAARAELLTKMDRAMHRGGG